MLALLAGTAVMAGAVMMTQTSEMGMENRPEIYEKMESREKGMLESVARAINLQDDRFAFTPRNPPDMSAKTVNDVLDNHAENNVEFMDWTAKYFFRPRAGRIAQQNAGFVPQLVETLTTDGRIGVQGDEHLGAYPYHTSRPSAGYKLGPTATSLGVSSENMPRKLRQANLKALAERRTPFGPSGFVTYAKLDVPSNKKMPQPNYLQSGNDGQAFQLNLKNRK
jgi:hypothetical protein